MIVEPHDIKMDFLGDGVYAVYKNGGVWLYANDYERPTDKIFLEPEVLSNLTKFFQFCVESN